MKHILRATGVLCVGLIVFLLLPRNFYLRKALIHFTPDIDDYAIFENRVVRAANPAPWPLADCYNTKHIPPKYLPVFDELKTVAYVIIQDSALVFEQYWDGYSSGSLSNSFSMAKSVVSLAVGCAIDDGFIRNVNQPVGDFIPSFNGFEGVPLAVKHLLTMSAALDFDEAYASPFSATTKFYYGNNLNELTLAMKQTGESGVHFSYQSGVTQLLAMLLEKATGESLSTYVSRKLWTPMGAEEDALWSLDKVGGMEKAYCCFNTNARDFARFGQLLLNHGKWNNVQLVSDSYLKEATCPADWLISENKQEPNSVYGYQFWCIRHKGMDIPYMRGILGQYVFAIPEKRAVVVRLGHKRSETRTDKNDPDDILVWLDTALDMLE